MSNVQRTYRVWNGCGWDRVTTSDAVWRATPRFRGVLTGCGATGGAIIVGGGAAAAWGHGMPSIGWPHFGNAPTFPGLEGYQPTPDSHHEGQEGGLMPAGYGNPPNSGVAVQTPHGSPLCPISEPSTLVLFGVALVVTIAVALITRRVRAVG